jgi:hypothetical protein
MKVLIAGGGIGGFATALSLHAVGVECEVFEQSTTIRELGVGINVLPHAVKELAGLGLLDALDRVAVRTSELAYTNRFGQQIWREPRGLEAGYDFPQLSIGRGRRYPFDRAPHALSWRRAADLERDHAVARGRRAPADPDRSIDGRRRRDEEGEARALPHRPPDGDARYQPAELGGGGQARRGCRAAAPA